MKTFRLFILLVAIASVFEAVMNIASAETIGALMGGKIFLVADLFLVAYYFNNYFKENQ